MPGEVQLTDFACLANLDGMLHSADSTPASLGGDMTGSRICITIFDFFSFSPLFSTISMDYQSERNYEFTTAFRGQG